jgi:two-component system sensor histidine kinase YesM
VFLPPHQITDIYGRAHSVISLTRPIIIFKGASPLGAILINLSTDTLADICAGASSGDSGYIFIVDRAGNYIYHPDPAYRGAQHLPTPIPDDEIKRMALSGQTSFAYGDRLVLSAAIEGPGYRVIFAMPRSLITGSADRQRALQLLFGAIASAVIALLLSLLLSRRVFRPLDKLRKLMGRVQKGDFSVRAGDTPQNEIGELAGGFNAMIDHNQRLMQKIIETEKGKRKAELDALQSQITPHFLYNTLDSIVWMSNYKPQVAAAMADALAKLFRLMLGGGEDIVPLKQEFEHVAQYLKIQKMRYDSRFEYEIQLDDACQSIRVPKLILQPLVENAIYHGVKPTRKKCLLKVEGLLDGDELVLMVMDDGAGMSPQELSRILTAERPSDKALGGVGVKNINERIQLYCPGGYGLSFLSREELGTVAIVRLPAAGV